MKEISIKKILLFTVFSAVIIISLFLLPVNKVNAAPAQATPTEPQNKQIIPYYEVWLRWNDVSNEHHYLLSMRDLDTNGLVYYNQYIAQNSSYFIIPVNKITKGHKYRWSLCSVDSSGNKTFSPEMYFMIEHGLPSGEDSHLWRTGYANASHLDYFIYAPVSGLETVIEQAVNSWNGISSKVYLHRDPANVTRELGIYDHYEPPRTDIAGKTMMGGMSYNCTDPYAYQVVTYVDILLYPTNFSSPINTTEFLKTTMHEVGHALSLGHTNGQDEGKTPNAPANNSIAKTYDDLTNIYLIMNTSSGKSNYITTVDRDHLRIKWGA